ncbi:MAG: ATP-binding cassette domain-containing protein, partial [Actinomycetes bacterium]
GGRGATISGGERQRLTVARALLRDPQVLLLDEATSQLDTVNELALRETIQDISRQVTVLVIAHRMATVACADRIVVLDGGTVAATGTHAELIGTSSLYRALASTQLAR